MQGKLYLIPSFLSENTTTSIPLATQEAIKMTNYFIVENIRTARRFIKQIEPNKNIDDCFFSEIDKHNNYNFDEDFLNLVFEGHNIGLLSEAGTPCVADPGFKIVALAHELNIEVVPFVGPNSIILALMASGFNGQQFAFHGYLPIETSERKKAILQLEQQVKQNNITQIFIETPYRNHQLLEDLIKQLHFKTMLCVACNLNSSAEKILSLPIAEWKRTKYNFHKQPCVFLIGK
ncbi:MAG: SAM-dependent methyltransferase [Chitinophagales bacterium]|nr:SAM-dependent methyltransferase [Chitinophagales bacterium]